MARWHKYYRLSGYAFDNCIRLHLDSVALYNQGSYASAIHLSILAKEELGKAIIFEELIYRIGITKEWQDDRHTEDFVMKALGSHAFKQRWFAGHANDFLGGRFHGKKYRYPSPIFREIYSGKTERKKQDSVYVGLTRSDTGKPDYNGRITLPWVRASKQKAHEEITLLNDFLIVYAEGYSRNVYATDSPGMAESLTQDTVKELEALWPDKSEKTLKIIKRLRGVPLSENKWGWWQD
jgi:AbiV family abortive infection protein